MPGKKAVFMLDERTLKDLENRFFDEIEKVKSFSDLFNLEKRYLGRKGTLTSILRSLKNLPLQARRKLGNLANSLRKRFQDEIKSRKIFLSKTSEIKTFDITEPGTEFRFGNLHPLTLVRREIEEFFKNFGFSVMEGPELENDYYNFESLNIPKDHPARDMWDTFWLKPENPKSKIQNPNLLLRAHTSAMQIRIMEKQKPPLAVIVPGRAFRHEATDARHEHTFNQCEGFYVAEDVSASHLKYLLHSLFCYLFGGFVKIKLRPAYFPFTEPSFELVMSCPFCEEKGCSVCGNGWLEMAGSGMIHPKVFEFAGYPKGKYRGFAFGIGMDRIAMLKYNIPDIRMFYQNDLRFLNQF